MSQIENWNEDQSLEEIAIEFELERKKCQEYTRELELLGRINFNKAINAEKLNLT